LNLGLFSSFNVYQSVRNSFDKKKIVILKENIQFFFISLITNYGELTHYYFEFQICFIDNYKKYIYIGISNFK